MHGRRLQTRTPSWLRWELAISRWELTISPELQISPSLETMMLGLGSQERQLKKKASTIPALSKQPQQRRQPNLAVGRRCGQPASCRHRGTAWASRLRF